jgi:hypothetical protein
MSYRSLRSVMFTSVSVWCITVRAILGEGIRPIGKKIYLESIATCQILFSKFGLSKPPLPSTTTLSAAVDPPNPPLSIFEVAEVVENRKVSFGESVGARN